MKYLLLILFLISSTLSIRSIDTLLQRQSQNKNIASIIKSEYPEFETNFISNKFDHFHPEDTRRYQQRYYQSSKYWDMEKGPIFVYICGEATCYPPKGRMFAYQMAQEHNALFLVLEHRYYGKSQ